MPNALPRSARPKMTPFQLDDEILVHLLRAHDASRDACTDDQAVFDCERVRRDVHRNPAGEVFAVEERNEPLRVRIGVRRSSGGENDRKNCNPRKSVERHGRSYTAL